MFVMRKVEHAMQNKKQKSYSEINLKKEKEKHPTGLWREQKGVYSDNQAFQRTIGQNSVKTKIKIPKYPHN